MEEDDDRLEEREQEETTSLSFRRLILITDGMGNSVKNIMTDVVVSSTEHTPSVSSLSLFLSLYAWSYFIRKSIINSNIMRFQHCFVLQRVGELDLVTLV